MENNEKMKSRELDKNEKRAMELKEKWGSSEYIRLLCGYLYCIGDKSDAKLIKEAKSSISWDVTCMIEAEWIYSLENGGIEDKENWVRTRDEIIDDFIHYSNRMIWSRDELDFSSE